MAAKINDYEGVLFALHRIQDLIYDFAHDSYRVPTLHTLGRVLEAIDFLENTPEKYINQNSLKPILQELVWSFKSDRVASELVGDNLNTILEKLTTKSTSLELKRQCNLLKYRLITTYRDENKKRLTELSVNGKRKKELAQCCQNYAVSILRLGYSRRYIRTKIKETIGEVNTALRAPQEITAQFLDSFEKKESDFSVITYVSKPLSKYIVELDSPKFRIFETQEELKAELDEHQLEDRHLSIILQNNPSNKVRLMLLKDLPAKDLFSAQKMSLDILTQFRSIAYAANNESNLSWTSSVVVVSKSEDTVQIVRRRRNILHNRRALADTDKIVEFRKHLTSVGVSNLDDKDRVFRSFSVASAAFELTHPESQLVSLWSALEAMLPEPNTSSRISSFLRFLVPANSIGYLNRVIIWNYKDLRYDIGKEFDEIVTAYNVADSNIETLALMMTRQEYNEHLSDILSRINNLSLRNRIFNIYSSWRTNGDVKAFLRNHEEKITWHIQRLYRNRNRIVHKGSALVNDTLVLNLDEYFLNMMAQIARYLECSSGSIKIDELFDLICEDHKFYWGMLNQNNDQEEVNRSEIPKVFLNQDC